MGRHRTKPEDAEKGGGAVEEDEAVGEADGEGKGGEDNYVTDEV